MEMKSTKNNSRRVVTAVIFAGAVAVANSAMADNEHYEGYNKVDRYTDGCSMLPLVDSALPGGVPNETVCVDAPVALTKVKTVFDINTSAPNGVTGLKHLMMMATAMKLRINAGLMDPRKVRIIGVLHGSGINLAMKDSTNATATGLINKIFGLQRDGVNITLEVCGVTMHSQGRTNEELYVGPEGGVIHVNQGAIGRIIDLEQHGYALIKE